MSSKTIVSPETKLTILIMFMIGYIFSPAVLWLWLSYELESGAFPVDADSIGLPMAGFLVLWFGGWILMIAAGFSVAAYRVTLGTKRLD